MLQNCDFDQTFYQEQNRCFFDCELSYDCPLLMQTSPNHTMGDNGRRSEPWADENDCHRYYHCYIDEEALTEWHVCHRQCMFTPFGNEQLAFTSSGAGEDGPADWCVPHYNCETGGRLHAVCPRAGLILPNLPDVTNQSYIYCTTEGEPNIMQCPRGRKFNASLSKCV